MSLRVCILSRSFYPDVGGLERIAEVLAKGICSAGHQVEVVTDSTGLSQESDDTFPFTVLRTHSFLARSKAFRRADILLFMNVSLNGLAAAALARAPVVISHHGVYGGHGVIGKCAAALKRFSTLFYTNISVSRFVAEKLPARSQVIPNAFDRKQFPTVSWHPREKDFVFCGRLVSDKGADNVIRAFAEVAPNFSDSRLTIIGDGPELNGLKLLAHDLELSSRVDFTGRLTGGYLSAELMRHTCLVVPSLVEEGFGIVALEGVASCETVIVYRRGGLPEAVGCCGVVVNPSINLLAVAMNSIANSSRSEGALPHCTSDEERLRHLARHSPETVTQQYLAVLEQALT